MAPSPYVRGRPDRTAVGGYRRPVTPYDDDLQLALQACDRADVVTMARFGALDLVVDTKPDLTPVSDADREVERVVGDLIGAQRPDDAMLGEEYGERAGRSGRRWVLDPIDGTKNFVRGVPVWATVLGLQDADGHVVVGAVSAPALGRRWWAGRGGGAYLSEPGRPEPRRIGVSGVTTLSDAFLSGSSQLSWDAAGRGTGWERLQRAVWRNRAFGDFWSHLLVAEGAIDLAAEPELNLYDVAGVSLVVTEAGGRFTGLDGVDGPDRGDALSSNGLLHDAALALLTS